MFVIYNLASFHPLTRMRKQMHTPTVASDYQRKKRAAFGDIWIYDLPCSRQVLYQLSYQDSSAESNLRDVKQYKATDKQVNLNQFCGEGRVMKLPKTAI